MTTLRVTLAREEPIEQTTVERIEAATTGELADDQPTLYFDSYATLDRFLTEANLELVETIAQANPSSVRETARLVGREYDDVHRRLTELADLGLVELTSESDAERPVVTYDDIEIAIDLASSDSRRTPARG